MKEKLSQVRFGNMNMNFCVQISNPMMSAFYIKEEHTSLPCCGFPEELMNKATEIGEMPTVNNLCAFLVLQSGR